LREIILQQRMHKLRSNQGNNIQTNSLQKNVISPSNLSMLSNTYLQNEVIQDPTYTDDMNQKMEQLEITNMEQEIQIKGLELLAKKALANNDANENATNYNALLIEDLTNSLSELATTVNTNLTNIQMNVDDINALKESLQTIFENGVDQVQNEIIQTITNDINQLKTNVENHSISINELQTTHQTILNSISELYTNVQANQGSVEALQTDVATMQASIQANQGSVEALQTDVATMQATIQANQGSVEAMQTNIQNLSIQMTDNEENIQLNTNEIHNLKTTFQTFQSSITNTSEEVYHAMLINAKKATSQIVFTLNNDDYIGSGWFYSNTPDDLINGYFVTAAHCVMEVNIVVYKATAIYIQNPITNRWMNVNVNNVYYDGIADVAVIKTNIDFTNYPEYCIRVAETMPPSGSECILLGNPGGLDEDSISNGVVRDNHYTEPSGYHLPDGVLVSSNSIGGNSGGPILDKKTFHVIGIYSFGLTGSSDSFGGGSNCDVLNATLPVLTSLTNNKEKLYMGVEVQVIDPISMLNYYNNNTVAQDNVIGSTISFDTMGLETTIIKTDSPFYKLRNSYGDVYFLLLSCTYLNSSGEQVEIVFGNNEGQRSLGSLMYLPVNTEIQLTFIKRYERIIRNTSIVLNKTYNDVNDVFDGPLQGGANMGLEKKQSMIRLKKLK
jgi:predicted nuclease with TOPRIM domain